LEELLALAPGAHIRLYLSAYDAVSGTRRHFSNPEPYDVSNITDRPFQPDGVGLIVVRTKPRREAAALMRQAGLRPTRQRLALAAVVDARRVGEEYQQARDGGPTRVFEELALSGWECADRENPVGYAARVPFLNCCT
jgi:hypothetical protein